MKKRVLCVYDGERRLWKDDMMLDVSEQEVRIPIAGVENGRAYVTDIDVTKLPPSSASANKYVEPRTPEFLRNSTLNETTASATKRQHFTGSFSCSDDGCPLCLFGVSFNTQLELDQHVQQRHGIQQQARYQYNHGQISGQLELSQVPTGQDTLDGIQESDRMRQACEECRVRKAEVCTNLNK